MEKLNLDYRKFLKLKHFNYSYFFMAALGFILLSGCSRYQYISIAGNIHQNKEKQFVVENDTAKITYSFAGADFPVTVQVFNKLQKPIYIDWSKSGVIIDGKIMSYWTNKAILAATSEGYGIQGAKNVSLNYSDINGIIYRNEKISFLPPQSFVKISRIRLKHNFFNTRQHDSLNKVSFATSFGKDWGKKYSFHENTSPLKFRSYITLSTNKDFSTQVSFDNTFWVDGILQTMASPPSLKYVPSTQSYIQKHTGIGKVIGWTVGLSILLLIFAIPK